MQDVLAWLSASPDFVEIRASADIVLDLRYATNDNVLGRNLYGAFNRAFLHRIAADKLHGAARGLKALKPGFKLSILDALRPRSVQAMLWDDVKGSEREPYVADPQVGSMHNFGLAVDLTILDREGRELDMGTGFDDFTPLAQPQLEQLLLDEGRLSVAQVANRRLLRSVMQSATFVPFAYEWWHFDALSRSAMGSRFRIVE